MTALRQSAQPNVVRVLIVDDSAVVRGLTKKWLESSPGVEVAGESGQPRLEDRDRLARPAVVRQEERLAVHGMHRAAAATRCRRQPAIASAGASAYDYGDAIDDRQRLAAGIAIVAAKRVFSEKGYSKSTMEDIAREAELSPGTLYLYFKNKDELFFSIIKEKSHWVKIPSAFIVMQLYLGSAAFFYFLIERIIVSK